MSEHKRYCGECMHLAPGAPIQGWCVCAEKGLNHPSEPERGGELAMFGPHNCEHFHPSLAAQQVEQLRIGNELAALHIRAIMDPGEHYARWAEDLGGQARG